MRSRSLCENQYFKFVWLLTDFGKNLKLHQPRDEKKHLLTLSKVQSCPDGQLGTSVSVTTQKPQLGINT